MTHNALSGALLFTLLSLPGVYVATDFLAKKINLDTIDASGTPTLYGIGLHAVVFFLLSFLLMKLVPASKAKSVTISIALAVLIAIVIFLENKKGSDKTTPMMAFRSKY
jgi:hypothetical protein